jgi:hypothetical protein
MSTNFPAVVGATDLAAALTQSKVTETASSGGVSFLQFAYLTGEYTLGVDKDDVTGDEVIVNTSTIKHGWILWSGGRPQKSMVPFNADIPMAMAPVGEDFPKEGRAFDAAMADDGEPVSFDSCSYGGRKAVDMLLGQIKAHSAEGSSHIYPRVKLTSESYNNAKQGGKLCHNPVFKIVAWCDIAGNVEPDANVALPASAEPEAPAAEVEAPAAERVDPLTDTRKRRKRSAPAAG